MISDEQNDNWITKWRGSEARVATERAELIKSSVFWADALKNLKINDGNNHLMWRRSAWHRSWQVH